MARVAIVGVGAIGGALAGLLETAGRHEITLCTRRPINALMVHTPDGDVQVSARNLTDPARAEAVDWVIVATKTYDAEGAAAWLPALCASGAPVAIVQNGVEHRERFAPYLSADRLLPVVIDVPTERQTDGCVRVRGATLMKVEDMQLGRDFAGLFTGTAAKMMLVDDFTTAAWWKLCINSVGALNALALKPAGILREEAMSRVAMEMVAECVAVGRAEGAKLEMVAVQRPPPLSDRSRGPVGSHGRQSPCFAIAPKESMLSATGPSPQNIATPPPWFAYM